MNENRSAAIVMRTKLRALKRQIDILVAIMPEKGGISASELATVEKQAVMVEWDANSFLGQVNKLKRHIQGQ